VWKKQYNKTNPSCCPGVPPDGWTWIVFP
jgi:hypothetical protein